MFFLELLINADIPCEALRMHLSGGQQGFRKTPWLAGMAAVCKSACAFIIIHLRITVLQVLWFDFIGFQHAEAWRIDQKSRLPKAIRYHKKLGMPCGVASAPRFFAETARIHQPPSRDRIDESGFSRSRLSRDDSAQADRKSVV